MESVKVSVIVPVYNGAETLDKCIASLLLQTLSPTEIIVVNDGSTDATAAVLEKYPQIRTITKPNAGQGYARNDGIAAARGEYIAFVDADDTIEPNMLEVMYTAAKKSGAPVTQCAINDIKGESSAVRPRTEYAEIPVGDKGDYIFQYMLGLIHTYEVCNKLWKTDFLRENNLRFCDTKHYYCEDLIFNFDAVACADKVTFVPQALYNYNISDSGHNRKNTEKKIRGLIEAFELVKDRRTDKSARHATDCTAAVILLCECVDMPRDFVAEILRTREMKRYMTSSMLFKSSPRHFLLMLYMRIMPMSAKIKMINSHFRY